MHVHTAIVHSPDIGYVFVYYFVFRGGSFELKKYEIPEISHLFILPLYQSYEYSDIDSIESLVK
jgi:hypothetical protein